MNGVGDQKVEDPEYEAKLMQVRMHIQKYARYDDKYSKCVKN